ncbi:MAG: RnfABCDGE type electron transport complex subunit D [Bacteroidia bacterium]|nr:RnfABCDGE type electron transport complex subunit D [Bacteroidia bacterium]
MQSQTLQAQPTLIESLYRAVVKFYRGDARHFQITYLFSFLCYGILALGWEANLLKYAVIFGTCLAVQALGLHLTKKPMSGLKSALITSLGLCLILKANLPVTLALAAALSIGSKFVLRYNNKHIFNPNNFGIIVTMLITGDAWISPGQWGSSTLLLFFIGMLGLVVLFKVGRIDTSLAFLGTFAVLQFAKVVLWQGWPMDFFFHQFTSGTLLLYSFFMITDPVTTPNAPKARILWAAGIALVSFILTNWLFLHTAPIWALFFIAPVTVFLDKKFKHKQFQWTTS